MCSTIDVRILLTAVYGKSIYWNIIKQWKRIKLHITTNQFKIYKAAFRSHMDCVSLNIYTIRVKGMTDWNGYPLQDSCLENSVDKGAWQATVYGVAQRVGHNFSFMFWKSSVMASGVQEMFTFFSLGWGAHRYSFYSNLLSHTLMLGVFSECVFYLTIKMF